MPVSAGQRGHSGCHVASRQARLIWSWIAGIRSARPIPTVIHPVPLTPRTRVRLSVDCMGGDIGPAVTLPACKAFLDGHPDAELLLVGSADALAPAAQW